MRLLVINPNTNVETTNRIAKVAFSVAAKTTEIDTISAQSGLNVIQSPDHSRLASKAVIQLVHENADLYDAIVIAAFSDPGMLEARDTTKIPVIGIGEASMLEATKNGSFFSIVTLGEAFREFLYEKAQIYGVRAYLKSIRFLNWSDIDNDVPVNTIVNQLVTICHLAISEDKAQSIVIGGGPLSGLALGIESQLRYPVFDGITCAINRAEVIFQSKHLT